MEAGLQITLYGPEGISFQCRYQRGEFATAFEAAQRLIARQDRYYYLTIEPSKEPPPPMTMEQWIAAGHTTD